MFRSRNGPRPTVDTWRDVGLSLKLKDKLDKSILREEELTERERKWRGIEFSKLLFSIYGVLSIRIRQAKNESSFTRRGLRVVTKNMGFR